MKAPVKLIKDGETIKGIFKFPLDFVEGSNTKDYPTALLNTTFYQFAPKGLERFAAKHMLWFDPNKKGHGRKSQKRRQINNNTSKKEG